MGPMRAPAMDEDCLTLNVWTAAPTIGERLPVLVFLHGGGYLAGAGSAAWYDGAVMARRGPAVVVTINYRLGALGYLYLPPDLTGAEPIANLGLQDQRLALEWVASNIHAFGGDASRITVFGQSGGGHSIVALQGAPRGDRLFHRAILQSPPLGLPAAAPEHALRVTRMFLDSLGAPHATLDDLRRVPLERVLDAQRAALIGTAAPGRLDPPFHLVVDGAILPEEPIEQAAEQLADVDLLLGFTADEASAFYAFDEQLWQLPAEALIALVHDRAGPATGRRLERYVDHHAGRPAAQALIDMVGDDVLIAPTVDLAQRRAAQGRPAHLYRVSWRGDAAEGRLGSCHTIELPFVFNNRSAWEHAPMLEGGDPSTLTALGTRMQDAWLAFAERGSPGHDGVPPWDACDATGAPALDFDVEDRIVHDLADGRGHLWELADTAPARAGD
jgi:para-nitrobenzyl esterase